MGKKYLKLFMTITTSTSWKLVRFSFVVSKLNFFLWMEWSSSSFHYMYAYAGYYSLLWPLLLYWGQFLIFFSKEHCFFELIVKKPIKTSPNQPHKTLHVMIIAWFLLPLVKDVRKIFFSGKWHIPWKCIKLCLNATYCHCQMRRSQSPIIYFSGFNTWLL